MDLNLALVIINIALVLVTIVYAILTYRIMKSNERTVDITKKQAESFYRPYITIVPTIANNTIITLTIKNTGKSNAENLSCKIDRNLYTREHLNDEDNLANHHFFTHTIETFPPETEIGIVLGIYALFRDKTVDHAEHPTVFNVTAQYSYSGHPIFETTTIDLRIFHDIILPNEPVAGVLKKMNESIKSINDTIKDNSKSHK